MFGPDRNTERLMEMWVDLLSQIENGEGGREWNRSRSHGTVEEREDCIVLTADLPGVEKKDIELSVHSESVSFKASTEDRDYDFGQSFDFELTPSADTVYYYNKYFLKQKCSK